MGHSSRQLSTTCLLILALIFNAVSSSAMATSVSKNGVFLCTSQGYQWVEVEQDIDKSAKVQKHCHVCLTPQNDDTDESFFALTTFFIPLVAQASLTSLSVAYIASNNNYRLAQGRAPPALL